MSSEGYTRNFTNKQTVFFLTGQFALVSSVQFSLNDPETSFVQFFFILAFMSTATVFQVTEQVLEKEDQWLELYLRIIWSGASEHYGKICKFHYE